jgi:hypothetical protein
MDFRETEMRNQDFRWIAGGSSNIDMVFDVAYFFCDLDRSTRSFELIAELFQLRTILLGMPSK